MAWKLRSRARLLWRGYGRLLPCLSIDGWLTVDEAIALHELARSTPDADPVVVEIGSFKGKSTVALGLGLLGKARPRLYSVDPFDGSGDAASAADYRRRQEARPLLQTFEDNLCRNGISDLVRVLKGYSHDAAAGFHLPIDLLFIDGDHGFAAVLQDFRDWSPKVGPGGTICLHDVGNPSVPGPKQVVDEELAGSPGWSAGRQVDSLFIARRVPVPVAAGGR